MKIQLLSSGSNKIETIKLIREYSGLSLKRAKELSENIPSSFICNLPEEKMFEIETDFTNAGVTIVIKPGFGTGTQGEDYDDDLLSGAFFGMVKDDESEEAVEERRKKNLESKQDVVNYLTERQNIVKAVTAGIISGVVILLLINFIMWFGTGSRSFFLLNWFSKIVISALIGLSVKKAGKGVQSKFGLISALISFAVIILIQFSFATYMFIYSKEIYYYASVFSPGFWSMTFTGIALFLSFKISFTNIHGKNFERVKTDLLADVSAAEIIALKRMQMADEIYDDEISSNPESFVVSDNELDKIKKTKRKRPKRKKRKRRSGIIPDGDDELNRFKY